MKNENENEKKKIIIKINVKPSCVQNLKHVQNTEKKRRAYIATY